MNHTPECLQLFEKAKEDAAQWVSKWPGHCPKCRGNGGRSYAATRWEPGGFDLCSCWESGKCPRCGHQHPETSRFSEDGEGPCEKCGWDHQNYTPDSVMPEYECWGCLPEPDIDFDAHRSFRLDELAREAESNVERLRAEGWTQQDFAQALKMELEADLESEQ
jgi:predicted  nucleic acid-binding Zn-ribbon protein